MDRSKFKAVVQVDTNHYNLSETSFGNLYNQIKDVVKIVKNNKIINPSILVIGTGDGLLKIILSEKFKYTVKTMDIDEELNPDYVGSVEDIKKSIDCKFDIVVCAHVLEHLPFDNLFEKSLRQLQLIAEYSIIYLPIAKFGIFCNLGIFPIFNKNIKIFSTWFFKTHKFDGQHYWEIGTKGYSLQKVKDTMKKQFDIVGAYNAKNWEYSYNFILRKKNKF